ncbi:hypothetical protein C1I63_01780 [Rathayibacter caricis DSM 15933]|jgi:hypothetical protein|uniref:Uncharacterized protein n=1 Tax=Rathayibacter caricis DSM 15933 TaxID=1328867 RepID=A0A2T4UQ98_9MICO|nr:hypothetical protein [Rathayibacter caricis]PTL71702.1 hypothetical protein C1I63_01780 [Rathayibacter caricis DSM 15933]
MTGRRTALGPLDETDALPRMRAKLVGGVLASPSARTGDGSHSTVCPEAALLGPAVILPLRKVR